jgi:hypothetical protein
MSTQRPPRHIFDLLLIDYRNEFMLFYRVYLKEIRRGGISDDKAFIIAALSRYIPKNELSSLLECAWYLAESTVGRNYSHLAYYGLEDFAPKDKISEVA